MKLQHTILTLFLVLGLGTYLNAQVRNCGTMEYLEYQQQIDPNRALKMIEIDL